MKKKTKIIISCGVVALVLAALVLPRFLKPKEAPDAVPPPTVRAEKPTVDTIHLTTALSGIVEPSDVVYITPKMPGEVTEVLVKAGDQVEEGQVICKIDTKQVDAARISLDTAALSLSDARTNVGRMQALYAAGSISAQSMEQAQNSLKMAQLQYDSAKLNYDLQLEYSTITSPISGVVESTDMEVHDMVSQQNLICVIAGEGSKAVSFGVTERVVKNIRAGDAIEIEKQGSIYAGTITDVNTMVDQATGLFKVKAVADGAEALSTGSAVKLHVTSEKAENVMTVPVNSVSYEGGAAFVYTFDNGTVHKVPVEVGLFDANKAQILSGISENDLVIVTWSQELYEGAPAVMAEETTTTGPKQ